MTALLLVPLVGIIALLVLLIWTARRRARYRPPIEQARRGTTVPISPRAATA